MLASEGWHPGVIGIVASRIAERHHRPAILIALDGEEGSGSGRSIKAFDLLGGLHAASGHLLRYGGHKAAAGLTIAAGEVDAFREAFLEHANAVLTDDDLVPEVRIDAVAQGDALSLDLAEELQQLAPFGMGNPGVSLLVPAATMSDPRGIGEGRHVAFTLSAGGAKSRCVSFGAGDALPVGEDELADAAVRLEIDRWNGAVSPKLVLRQARPCAARDDRGGRGARVRGGRSRELERDLDAWLAGGPAPAHASRGDDGARRDRDPRAAPRQPAAHARSARHRDRGHPRRPRRVGRAGARRDRARAVSRADARRARGRLRGRLVGGAGGRSGARARLSARRRGRPTHTAPAGPSGR